MIEVWIARHGVAIADWPDQPVDPFFNVNTPEDAARVERIALQQSRHVTFLTARSAPISAIVESLGFGRTCS